MALYDVIFVFVQVLRGTLFCQICVDSIFTVAFSLRIVVATICTSRLLALGPTAPLSFAP